MKHIHKQSKSPFGMMFEELFNRSINEVMGVDQSRTIPQVNIHETDASYILELATPGLSKDDFSVSIEKKVLTIEAKQDKETEAEKKVLRNEFNYGTFKRTFTLSDDVNMEHIEASYTDGILKVVLEKLPIEVVNKIKKIAIG